nr:ANTAR domain-containing protein [Clostridium sp. D33t1_170424_F3]
MDEKQIVDRAKQLLIYRCNLSESAAHRFLQKRSMNSSKKLCETAMLVLETLGASS